MFAIVGGMKKASLQEVTTALQGSWTAETAFDATEWSEANRARGQCVVSSLVVQDYLGGELIRFAVDEGDIHETHYMNQLPDGTVVDTTASQYTTPVTMRRKPVSIDGFSSIREKRLADESTKRRYLLLRQRVAENLA